MWKSKDIWLTRDSQDFVDALDAADAPPLYTLPPEEAREVLMNAQSGTVFKHEADVRDVLLPVGPTGGISVRIIRPKGATGRLPCIFYLHGGGWVLGNADTHDRLIRELSVEVGAAIVFPEYAPSPENAYPVALEQCYAVLEHIGGNSEELGLSSGGIVIAGDSVGGGMATALAMMSMDRGGPRLIFQMLFYPTTDANFDTESYSAFAKGPWLTRKAMKWFWDAYLPGADKRKEKYASPLQADDGDLIGLPPALVITAENDVLRDEGEEYARRLDMAGVRAVSVRVNGTMHDFVMLDALADTIPTRSAMTLAVAEIKKAFRTACNKSRVEPHSIEERNDMCREEVHESVLEFIS